MRAEGETIGVAGGERTTNIRAVADDEGRLRRFNLPDGIRHDAAAAEPLFMSGDADPDFMIGAKDYGSNELRETSADAGMEPVIPFRKSAAVPADYDRELHKERNPIDLAFYLIKDFRRISTRYDSRRFNLETAAALGALKCWFLV